MTPVIFDATQFGAFLSDYQQADKREVLMEKLKGRHIIVSESVILGPDTKLLPESLTFGGDITNVVNSSLSEFNSEVKGFFNMSGNKTIKTVGEQARFEKRVFGQGCGVVEFNGKAMGPLDLQDAKNLRRFGPNAVFRDELNVSASGLSEFNHVVFKKGIFNNVPNLKELGPKAKFLDDFEAIDSGLVTFGHEVVFSATLKGCKSLDIVTPETKIGRNLDLSDSTVRCIEGAVGNELRIDNVQTIERVGPQAKFGSVRAKGSNIGEFRAVVAHDAEFGGTSVKFVHSDSSFGGSVSGLDLPASYESVLDV